jgi:predicted DNA-binding transcriptional regulator YafY
MPAPKRKPGARSTQKDMMDRHKEIRLAMEMGQGDVATWIQEKFGFGPRTARRDLAAIKRADPTWWKKHAAEQRGIVNGVSANDGHMPARPELEEAIAGVVVLEKLTGGLLSIARRQTTRVVKQTERLLSRADEDRVKVLRRFIQLRHQPSRITERQTIAFATIVQAHLDGLAVEIAYAPQEQAPAAEAPATGKARKAAPRRRVGPVCLFHAKRSWYLLAKVLEGKSSGELRQFKLDRIERIDLAKQPFRAPGDFDLDAHLEGAWEMFHRGRGSNERLRVVVEFDPLFARTISETLWHATQHTEPLPGGGLRLTATVNGFEEILWWVLQMGSHAKVIEPAELRQLVAKELDATRRMYA